MKEIVKMYGLGILLLFLAAAISAFVAKSPTLKKKAGSYVLIAVVAGAGLILLTLPVESMGEHRTFLPIVAVPCDPPPATVEEGQWTGNICGGAILQWYSYSQGEVCGIMRIEEGQFFSSSVNGYYWRLTSQEQLDEVWPGHRDTFLQNNPSCYEGLPPKFEATPTPPPTGTPAPGVQLDLVCDETGNSLIGSGQLVSYSHQGAWSVFADDGDGEIVVAYDAFQNGVANLGYSYNNIVTSIRGQDPISLTVGTVYTMSVYGGDYTTQIPVLSEEDLLWQSDPMACEVVPTPEPVETGIISPTTEFWGPTTFQWERPGIDSGIAVLWLGNSWISGAEMITGTWKLWSSDEDAGWYWDMLVQGCTGDCIVGFPPQLPTATPTNTPTPTPTNTPVPDPTPVASGIISANTEYWGPTTFQWSRPVIGDHGVAVLWNGNQYVSGPEEIEGTWKTWSSDQDAGWYWNQLVATCTGSCIVGFPPYVPTPTP